jgi:predicted porin
MKKTLSLSIAAISVGAFANSAHAQSSVTLYGIVDDSFVYTNNQAGHAAYQMQAGLAQGERWGLRGREDLGNGLAAVFTLESGFNNNTGGLSQGGRIFGRPAFVGLSSATYGAFTMGRQNEEIGDYLSLMSANASLPGGIIFPHPGDLDNNGIDFRLQNSVKYTSPVIGGFSGAAVYSFGGTAGNFALNSGKSFALNYAAGPITLVTAYTAIDHPATAVTEGVWTPGNTVDGNYGIAAAGYKVFGAGGAYVIGPTRVSVLWDHTQFSGLNPTLGAKIPGHVTFNIYEVQGSYQLTTAVQLGAAYSFTVGNVSATRQEPRYHELDGSVDYAFSARTDAYVTATYMHAQGGAVANLAPVIPAASGDSQLALMIGLRVKF